MSIVNIMLVASREAAIAYANEDIYPEHYYEFGGMTDLEISILFAIVVNEPFDFDKHELLPMGAETKTELYPLPERFISKLASMDLQAMTVAATNWAQEEELDCPVDDVMPIVLEICKLAEKVKDGLGMYFVMA